MIVTSCHYSWFYYLQLGLKYSEIADVLRLHKANTITVWYRPTNLHAMNCSTLSSFSATVLPYSMVKIDIFV